MVKCLVCGAVFESGLERCPVCGVGPENFIPAEESKENFRRDTDEYFIILGGGTAAVSAAEAVRARNATASITLVTEELDLPYNRPMLTKSFYADLNSAKIAIHDADWYDAQRITLLRGERAAALDTADKTVTLESGQILQYDRCIYAMGAHSFLPPFPGNNLPEVVTIRTTTDVRRLAALLPNVREAVVVGAGVLGLEAAGELRKAGCCVTLLDTSERLLQGKIALAASELLAGIVRGKGIAIETAAFTADILGKTHVEGVRLKDGRVLPADLVVVSTGVRPNIEVAQAAGLAIGRAVIVDQYMRTSAPDVYACGDCAELDGVNFSVWPEATAQGEVAGANAGGDNISYQNQTPAMTLNAMGTSLYAIGDNGGRTDVTYRVVEQAYAGRQSQAVYFFVDERLVGATLLGDTTAMAGLTALVERGATPDEIL